MAFGDRKKTAFHTKPRKPMKRSTFTKKAVKKRSKRQIDPNKKVSHKGYKPPKWFMKIKPGSHGSTPAQKRYWKVISDTYREADWKKYKCCVSCKQRIEHWKDGDLAHFKKYSVCNSWFKFQRENLALSCKGCNQRDDGPVGHAFGEELKRRYHKGILEWIESTNQAFKGQKMETWDIVERTAQLRPDLVELSPTDTLQ